MNIIEIKNLNFSYHNKILDNINLKIKESTLTTIIGRNGSGKSTLVKILVGLLDYSGEIIIDKQILNKENINDIRKKIGVVFENPDCQFITETVFEELAFILENMNYKKNIIKEKVNNIVKLLELEDVLKENPNNLNNSKKQLVSLATALVHEPKILILDEALTYIDLSIIDKINKILLDLKQKGLTIIQITHDIETTLISDKTILLEQGKIVFNGTKRKLYEFDIQKYGFNYPFIIELSNRLMFYNLIDKHYYSMEALVDKLWK